MRKLKYSISRNALNQMYMSYMPSVVEYVSVVWVPLTRLPNTSEDSNEVARLVTGLTRSVSLENLYK